MPFVKVLAAHCSSCNTESLGFYVNIDDDGVPILGEGFFRDRPYKMLEYPVVVPTNDVAPIGDTYECELCGGIVLVAMEPA
jgi:hypothetical protein